MAEILGLGSFQKSDGTNKQIAVANGDAFVYNSANTTWEAQNQYLNVTAKAEFDTFLDYLFMVNYNDPTRTYSGSAWSNSTNVTSAPKAKYIKVFQTRVYLGYCNVSSTAYPSRVYYSSIPSASAITWNTTDDWFDVRTDDGDVLMGFGLNNNRLLCFKKNSLHRWDTYSLVQVRGSVGTTSQRSVCNVRDWTIFLHLDGFFAYDGVSSKLISNPIKPFIDGIPSANFSTAVAWREGNHYRCFVGNITNVAEDISLSNVVLDYDVSLNSWTIHTLQDVITCAAEYIASDVRDVFVGTDSARFRKLEDGNSDTSGASSLVAIPFEVETIEYYPGDPETLKSFPFMYVYASRGSGISVSHKVVGKPFDEAENWIPAGQLRNRVTRIDLPLRDSEGRGITLKFSESSSVQPVTIEGFSLYYIRKGLR